MQKPAIAIGVILIAALLAVPLLPTETEGGGDAEPAASPEAAPVEAEPAPRIPSEYEAPPLWNAGNLTGTAWEADMSEMPAIDDPDSDLLIRYEFFAPGRLRLSFERDVPEGEDEDEGLGETFFQGFLPDTEGTYTVEGAQIHVSARMITGESTDVIEIRGDQLYYHGAAMTPLHAPAEQAPVYGY